MVRDTAHVIRWPPRSARRRAALERADEIVVLDRGQVVARGPLAELLGTSAEMRRPWSDQR